MLHHLPFSRVTTCTNPCDRKPSPGGAQRAIFLVCNTDSAALGLHLPAGVGWHLDREGPGRFMRGIPAPGSHFCCCCHCHCSCLGGRVDFREKTQEWASQKKKNPKICYICLISFYLVVLNADKRETREGTVISPMMRASTVRGCPRAARTLNQVTTSGYLSESRRGQTGLN